MTTRKVNRSVKCEN